MDNMNKEVFTEKIHKETENFNAWIKTMISIQRNVDALKDSVEKIKEFDAVLSDLKKVTEETVKIAEEM